MKKDIRNSVKTTLGFLGEIEFSTLTLAYARVVTLSADEKVYVLAVERARSSSFLPRVVCWLNVKGKSHAKETRSWLSKTIALGEHDVISNAVKQLNTHSDMFAKEIVVVLMLTGFAVTCISCLKLQVIFLILFFSSFHPFPFELSTFTIERKSHI